MQRSKPTHSGWGHLPKILSSSGLRETTSTKLSKETLGHMGLHVKNERHLDRAVQTPMWSWLMPNNVYGRATSVDILDANPGKSGVCSDWVADVGLRTGKHWFIVSGDAAEVISKCSCYSS